MDFRRLKFHKHISGEDRWTGQDFSSLFVFRLSRCCRPGSHDPALQTFCKIPENISSHCRNMRLFQCDESRIGIPSVLARRPGYVARRRIHNPFRRDSQQLGNHQGCHKVFRSSRCCRPGSHDPALQTFSRTRPFFQPKPEPRTVPSHQNNSVTKPSDFHGLILRLRK